MKILHLPKQNEIHLLPVYRKLSETELNLIAIRQGISSYEVDIKSQMSCEEKKSEFQCYVYVIKY